MHCGDLCAFWGPGRMQWRFDALTCVGSGGLEECTGLLVPVLVLVAVVVVVAVLVFLVVVVADCHSYPWIGVLKPSSAGDRNKLR